MISKKRLVCLLVKSAFSSLFAAAEREFDKLFTLSLSKSNSEFVFPPSNLILFTANAKYISICKVCLCLLYFPQLFLVDLSQAETNGMK